MEKLTEEYVWSGKRRNVAIVVNNFNISRMMLSLIPTLLWSNILIAYG
jgi:hypothetical protein